MQPLQVWLALGGSFTVYVEGNRFRHDDGNRRAEIKMTLTALGCGMGESLVSDVRSKLELVPTIA